MPYLLLLAALAALLATPAAATQADMEQLPVFTPFACANCHVLSEPNANSFELNDFGLDFLAAGRRWNYELAKLDSDGDGCLNGVELGDVDGNGVADNGVQEESSNPGAPDCSSTAHNEEFTWSELKSLFNGR
ncbi:MAG TPA: hypothetical protein P5571_02050 [Candidatus Krumholzibacteria bacterium]|nr:hypothetical protein [Candidatus Krumholzibacteria bacterium]HRX50132.1 hypothetical protein [Candidatus Krumholzibacteria bacterium]